MKKEYTNMGAQFRIDEDKKKRLEDFRKKKDWALAKTIKNAVLFALDKGFDK